MICSRRFTGFLSRAATRNCAAFIMALGLLQGLCMNAWADGNSVCILISFDGFRHDYISRLPNGAIKELIAHGCTADALIPVNPTKTFPNHWSIATGLYPSDHGIVDNRFYDRVLNDTFNMTRTEPVWWRGEPIWTTVERAGKTAFTYFWPGSSTPINGHLPSKWFTYEHSRDYTSRVDSIVTWASMPKPPDLIVSYFELLDDAGHRYGPNAPQVDSALAVANSLISRLVKGLEARGVINNCTIVLVSDHGMAEINPATPHDKHLSVEQFMADPTVRVIVSNPNILVYGLPGTTANTIAAGINADSQTYRATATPVSDLDTAWHIQYPGRTPDLIVTAEYGYDIDVGKRPARKSTGGNHGYSNSISDMNGIFVASGDKIKPGRVQSLSVIDVYNIICKLTNVPPARNSGNANRVSDVVH
ncbi:MAG: ectonucleotide pyrophosphatase/phosphodiesterase [Ignavibacteria bacterium]|nr:ectonucleotide pyrophosphatase/phosphodiesterase [Ignavibacteria bacterium]QOJ25916.1 MAG: alkaline phosphatase family protein [Ignavibacteria bacterium]